MINTYIKSIKAIRLERGISQLDMAKKLEMSRASYIAIEQGKRELAVSELEKIADILGVSFNELESGESPNYEKYRQMILAFLREGGKIPKTKLAKLLYFADFSWFYVPYFCHKSFNLFASLFSKNLSRFSTSFS